MTDEDIVAALAEVPVLLPLAIPSLWPSNVLACNGCGSLVLNNPNAKSMHLDWHRAFTRAFARAAALTATPQPRNGRDVSATPLTTTTPPHVLVVTDEDGDGSWMGYAIECPGVTDVCAEWLECMKCTRQAREDEEYAEKLHEDGEAHGVDHNWWDGTWWTPGHERCWMADCSELADAAETVPGADKPGRYPVSHAVEDGEYLILGPAAVHAEAAS